MAYSVAQEKHRIIANYTKKHLEYFEEFIDYLDNPEIVKIVKALEEAGYCHFEVVEIIVFGDYEIYQNCVDLDDVAIEYLKEYNLITSDTPRRYINVAKVLYDFDLWNYKCIPFEHDKYIVVHIKNR